MLCVEKEPPVFEFILEFIRSDPKLVLMIFALLISTFAASLALTVKKINETNRFYDKLEADSVYQISENIKNIERILTGTTGEKSSDNSRVTLRDAMDDYPNIPALIVSADELEKLSKHFADMCANLDKYNDNVINRKGFCMKLQEYRNYARRILSLFEKTGFNNISLGFAQLHLKRAGVVQ